MSYVYFPDVVPVPRGDADGPSGGTATRVRAASDRTSVLEEVSLSCM